MKEVSDLFIKYVNSDTIREYANNTKIHNRQQVKQIKKSIETFGYINPILVDEKNEIIAGHGRLRAAIEAGMKEVPVIQIKHLTDVQKKAYRIADNKLTENGKWDIELLQVEFKEIESLAPEITLDTTGFAIEEIDKIFKVDCSEIDAKSDTVPYISEDLLVSNVGDIWQLGQHKIICGNSLNTDVYKELLSDKKADLIVSDPPYNVKINGHVCGSGKIKHKEFAMASGEMSSEEFTDFLNKVFENLTMFSNDGSLHYLFMDWAHCENIINAAKDIYTELKNICIWNKMVGGMGSMYRSQHEFVFQFKNGTNPHTNNINLGANGRYRTNVWNYPGVSSSNEGKKNLKMHPTVKPVSLIKDIILDASKRNDIILDSFLGSGSTLIAAEQSGRICYGIEIDPLYIDTAIRRYIDLTGKDAIHLKSGKKYSELLKEKEEQNEKQ